MKPTNHFTTLLYFIVLISSFPLNAQQEICHTGPGGLGAVGIIPPGLWIQNTGGPYFIKVYPHVLRDLDGTGGQSPEAIEAAFDILDENFNPHGIYFVRPCEVNDILIAEYADINYATYCDFSASLAYQNNDGIDIIFGPDNAGFLAVAKNIPSSEFIIQGTSGGTPALLTSIIPHEMGHCLGLWHTFHGTAWEGVAIDCDAGIFVDMYDIDPNACCELASGSNGTTCGDYVQDTRADCKTWATSGTLPDPCADLTMDFDVTDNGTCSQISLNTPNWIADQNEQDYNPPVDNIMSYGLPECKFYFTEGQGERMRQMISFSPVLQACLVEADFTDIDIDVTTTWTTLNTVNDGDFIIEDELVVESGVTLTIEAGVTVRFGTDGRVIIEPDAHLILEGTLTGMGCQMPWQGIEVWGDSDASQISFGTQAQGRFTGKPGALVENAEVGARLYGPSYTNNAGGQISCTGTTFLNNHIAVEFAPYQNFWPFPFPTGWENQPRDYFGGFIDCTFLTDDNYAHDLPFESFLHLTGVSGVKVLGSAFTNTQTIENPVAITDYGHGIFATDADFEIRERCLSNTFPCSSFERSTFTGLGYGIYVSNVIGNRPYIVRLADFTACYVGLYHTAVNNGTIILNDFYLGDVPDPSIATDQFGVFFQWDIAGFTMEENDFIGTAGNVNTTVGTFCGNIGQFNNRIRRNNYTNLDFANVADGENATVGNIDRGLHYLCNDNTNINEFDFAVGGNLNAIRIRKTQGIKEMDQFGNSIFHAAGNTFSYGTGVDFANLGEPIDYYHTAAPNETPITMTGSINTSFALDNNCPVTFCEPPCKTKQEIRLIKGEFYQDEVKETEVKAERELALMAGDEELAEQKEKEAAYHRLEMDKAAFMVVLHTLYDTLTFHPDTLDIWIQNLDVFGIDIVWSLQQQSSGNTIAVQDKMRNIDKKTNLTRQQERSMQQMPELLDIVDNKSPYQLDRQALIRLKQLAENEETLTGNIAKNILTLHGYKFPLIYHLPRPVAEFENTESDIETSTELSVYPNPNNGVFNVLWKPGKKSRNSLLEIRDLAGRLVHQQQIKPDTQHQLNLRQYQSGIYFYQLNIAGQEPKAGKLIIQ